MTRTLGLALAGGVLGLCLSVSAWAFPTAPVDSKASSGIILVAKCGDGSHKDEHGHCAKDDRDHCAKGRNWNEKSGRCEK